MRILRSYLACKSSWTIHNTIKSHCKATPVAVNVCFNQSKQYRTYLWNVWLSPRESIIETTTYGWLCTCRPCLCGVRHLVLFVFVFVLCDSGVSLLILLVTIDTIGSSCRGIFENILLLLLLVVVVGEYSRIFWSIGIMGGLRVLC